MKPRPAAERMQRVQFIPCVSECGLSRPSIELDKRPLGRGRHRLARAVLVMDIGCTVMLILLAAVDEGLAAGFAGTHDPARLNAELDIPADFSVSVGVIPVGRPLPDKRFAIAEARPAQPGRIRLGWETWGS